MSYPKMTLRVQVSKDDFEIIFDLIQVTDIYRLDDSKTYQSFTRNDWMFMLGENFCINEYSKICTIPKITNKSRSWTKFKSEQDRYEFLKDFHEALLLWSSFNVFKGKKIFSDKPNIKFHKNVWIIF